MVDDPKDVEAIGAALDTTMREVVDYAVGKFAPTAEALHLLGAVAMARQYVDDAEWLGWAPGVEREPRVAILRNLDRRNEAERMTDLRKALRQAGHPGLAERIVTVYNAAAEARHDIAHATSHVFADGEPGVLVLTRQSRKFEQVERRYTTIELRRHAKRAEWVVFAVAYVQHIEQRIQVKKKTAGAWIDQEPNVPPLPS